MKPVRPARLIEGALARRLAGWLLLWIAAGLLLWDLDHVPLWTLALAIAAFVAGGTLLARRAY